MKSSAIIYWMLIAVVVVVCGLIFFTPNEEETPEEAAAPAIAEVEKSDDAKLYVANDPVTGCQMWVTYNGDFVEYRMANAREILGCESGSQPLEAP